MLKLGTTGRDKITGFTGVIVGRVEYISGCNQVMLSPKAKPDGEYVSSNWFDEQRIEVMPGIDAVVLAVC